ncbi:MAG: outer membrane protein transport protein, partial [Bdellovibrionales bacterium]|nr:outer membrane protein transport protein [Bdellovibrionales bacterium]
VLEKGGSALAAALGGGPVAGGGGGNGGEPGYVPNVYLVTGFAEDRLKLGLGINSPFGLLTKYDADWVGRYHAIKSDLLTVNINPALSYEVNDYLSLGGGVSVMYADAELTNAVDFGTVGVAALGPQTAAQFGLLPQAADGRAIVEGDDWGVGYSLGALLTLGDTKFGVHFRSKVDLSLRGEGSFELPQNARPLTATGLFSESDVQADVTLPETIAFDVRHDITEDWYAAFGALWTRWNRLDELRVVFDNAAQPDSVIPLAWDPTWRFAWGTGYRVSDTLTVRGGLTYEETPISSGDFRTPRIPDNDRFWVATGLTYSMSDSFDIDFSYSHVFVEDAKSNVLSPTGNTLDGEYALTTDIVALAFTYRN